MHVILYLPGVVRVVVPLPLDEQLETRTLALVLDDVLHLVMLCLLLTAVVILSFIFVISVIFSIDSLISIRNSFRSCSFRHLAHLA